MTSLFYPRYRVITGLLVTVALLLIGVGAIVSLVLTPLAGGQQATYLQLLMARVYLQRSKRYHTGGTLCAVFDLPCHTVINCHGTAAALAGHVPAHFVNESGYGTANNSCGDGAVGGLGADWSVGADLFWCVRFYHLRPAWCGVGAHDAECAIGSKGDDAVVTRGASGQMAVMRPFGHDIYTAVLSCRMARHLRRNPGLVQPYFSFMFYLIRASADAWWRPRRHHSGSRNL